MLLRRQRDGYSFIELTVALGLFSLLSISVLNIVRFAYNANERISIRQELFESSRISLDFIETQVRMADGVKLVSYSDGTMAYLETFKDNVSNSTFKFSETSSLSDIHYHRVEFGGRSPNDGKIYTSELAKYISDIRMTLDKQKNILNVKVITDQKLKNSKITVEPIVLERNIYLKYKNYK